MDFEMLRLFAEVAEQGSLTRASIALSSTPSALSRKIASLEQECGLRLFHRTGRGVALTEFGQRILPRVQELLSGLEHLSTSLRTSAAVPMGEVRIGFLASLSSLIDRLFREVRVAYPEIHLSVFGGTSGQLDEWLASGHVDMAVLFRYGKSEIGDKQVLGVVDTYLIGPPGDPITRNATVKFSRINELPLILPSPPNGLRNILDRLAQKRGVTLSIVMEANSIPIQKDIVAGGGIHTVVAGYAATREVNEGMLQASRIVSPQIERAVTLEITPHKPASLTSLAIVELISKVASSTPATMGLRAASKTARKRLPR